MALIGSEGPSCHQTRETVGAQGGRHVQPEVGWGPEGLREHGVGGGAPHSDSQGRDWAGEVRGRFITQGTHWRASGVTQDARGPRRYRLRPRGQVGMAPLSYKQPGGPLGSEAGAPVRHGEAVPGLPSTWPALSCLVRDAASLDCLQGAINIGTPLARLVPRLPDVLAVLLFLLINRPPPARPRTGCEAHAGVC